MMARVIMALLLPVLLGATEIPKGTHILLRMVNSISSKTAQPGDQVYMTTAFPVTVAGNIVVPVNSCVQGVVTHAKRSGQVRGKAQLGIRIETLTLPNGKLVKLTPVLDSVDPNQTGQKVDKTENMIQQAPDHGKDTSEVAILAGTGASIGGLADHSWYGAGIGAGAGAGAGIARVLLSRGREAELPQGASLDVVLDRSVQLDPNR